MILLHLLSRLWNIAKTREGRILSYQWCKHCSCGSLGFFQNCMEFFCYKEKVSTQSTKHICFSADWLCKKFKTLYHSGLPGAGDTHQLSISETNRNPQPVTEWLHSNQNLSTRNEKDSEVIQSSYSFILKPPISQKALMWHNFNKKWMDLRARKVCLVMIRRGTKRKMALGRDVPLPPEVKRLTLHLDKLILIRKAPR